MLLMRLLGLLLGVMLIVLGVCAFIYFTEIGVFQRIFGGIAMIVTGVYFANYGITGRRYLFGKPPI